VSLGRRLIVALVVIVVLLVAAGFVIVQTERDYLIDQLDRQLVVAAAPARVLSIRLPTAPPQSFPAPPDLFDLYIARVSDTGAVLQTIVPGQSNRRPDMRGQNLARLARTGHQVSVGAKSGDGELRAIVVPITDGFIVLAFPLDRVHSATERLVVVVTIAGVGIALVLALLAWWVRRLGLQPIRQMTDTADAIAQGELDRRVEARSPSTEAGRLARAFNVMLDERQEADRRLRRFLADASHELRTPLTSIRGYLELYERGALAERPALDDAMRRVRQESMRMTDLVEDLLLLARLDEGRPLRRASVDVTQLLRDAAADASAVQPDRPLTIDVADGLAAEVDEDRIRQVIAALLSNALMYTQSSVAITVRGRQEDSVCVIEVDDQGPGMEPELAANAFGRFARGADAAARHHGGTGLGLSIVEAVVEAHDGRVTLETAPGRGTCVRVVLPVRADDQETSSEG
jgi:two-component system, OmpR family, sensor kinase